MSIEHQFAIKNIDLSELTIDRVADIIRSSNQRILYVDIDTLKIIFHNKKEQSQLLAIIPNVLSSTLGSTLIHYDLRHDSEYCIVTDFSNGQILRKIHLLSGDSYQANGQKEKGTTSPIDLAFARESAGWKDVTGLSYLLELLHAEHDALTQKKLLRGKRRRKKARGLEQIVNSLRGLI